MKRTLILSVGLLVLAASCKKSNSAPESPNLSFSLDGSVKTISTVAGQKNYISGSAFITIVGATATGEGFTLEVNNSISHDSIAVGTYADTSSHLAVTASYIPSASTFNSYDAGSDVAQSAAVSGVTIANHYVLKITAVDAQSIKGTFSGDFYYNGDVSASKKTITNGNFYVKYQ